MSNQPTVNGIPCEPGRVLGTGGHYIVEISKSDATLEQIEAIDWAHPTLVGTGDSLPDSYGYEVTDVRYSYQYKKFQVHLKVKEEYLGTWWATRPRSRSWRLHWPRPKRRRLPLRRRPSAAEAATAQAQAQQATEDCLAAQQEAKTAQQMPRPPRSRSGSWPQASR